MKEQLLQEAYDKFRLSLGQEPQPLSLKAMEYFCEAMDKYCDFIKTQKDINIQTCAGCGYQTPIWNTIDTWALKDGKPYCRKCQKSKKQ